VLYTDHLANFAATPPLALAISIQWSDAHKSAVCLQAFPDRHRPMRCVAAEIGVAATTITRLARTDDKAASSLPLDLAGKILTVLEVGIGDLLEVLEA